MAAARRNGIGRALVRHAAEEARRAGARIAVLAPTPESTAFHAALGFVLRAYPPERSY